jgi:hypothetical protein
MAAPDEQAVPADDPRRALVERVRSGASLRKSPRLQRLLDYLCERALGDPHGHIVEHQIGVAVFERTPGYDTNVDTIVRVQVSALRRKLEQHFLAEGIEEPVVIDVPKGSYRPVFRPRAAGASVDLPLPSMPAAPRPFPRLAMGMGVLVLAVAVLAVDNARLRSRSAATTPFLDHFWGQFLENGRPTQVVLSDASATLLAEALGRSITLADYRRPSYPASLTDTLPLDPSMRTLLWQSAVKGLTTPQDARIARDVSLVCAQRSVVPEVVAARDAQLDLGRLENLVMLGARRANPWMELFEGGLNFTYRFDDARRVAWIANRSPRPGEEPTYTVQWLKSGYCVVAYIPKPRGTGSALLIFGADSYSVAAGGQLVTGEPSLADLHARLGIGRTTRIPYFEVLLRTNVAGTLAANYTVVAHRIVPPPTS